LFINKETKHSTRLSCNLPINNKHVLVIEDVTYTDFETRVWYMIRINT